MSKQIVWVVICKDGYGGEEISSIHSTEEAAKTASEKVGAFLRIEWYEVD